jgi:hypothetical protein
MPIQSVSANSAAGRVEVFSDSAAGLELFFVLAVMRYPVAANLHVDKPYTEILKIIKYFIN